MNSIGLDPGSDGAMAVITPSHQLRVYGFNHKSEQEIMLALLGETLDPHHAFLELVRSRPGQGVTSMFTFGRNLGFLRGLLVALGVPFEDVPPQEWQKKLGLGKAHPSQADRKRAHKQYAEQLFPNVKVTLANADAILIAEYGYRTLNRK